MKEEQVFDKPFSFVLPISELTVISSSLSVTIDIAI